MHSNTVKDIPFPVIPMAQHFPGHTRNRLLVTPVEAGSLVGWAKQTVYNKLHNDSFGIPLVEFGGRKMVRVIDLMRFIEGLESKIPASIKHERRPGRPTKTEAIRRKEEKKWRGK